jgi:hypothetical protein
MEKETTTQDRRIEKLRRELDEATLRADALLDEKVLAEYEAHDATKRLAAAEKTLAKQQRRIKNLELFQNSLKDELHEAKEAVRNARHKVKLLEGEVELLTLDRERYFSVVESLARVLERGAKP